MPALPLVIVQYAVEYHDNLPEHWGLAVQRSRRNADIFELWGNRRTYTYIATSTRTKSILTPFDRWQSLRGGVQIGLIEEDKVGWLKDILKRVPVVRHSIGFDCQVWVLEAIRLLREVLDDEDKDGVTIMMADERDIREELAREKERWDLAEDVLQERLYQV